MHFANLRAALLWKEHSAKLLAIDLDITLKDHVRNICTNSVRKISILAMLADIYQKVRKTFDENHF